ncbi:MAG: hypothetical protein WAQ27_04890 [Candidatus Microsaccharimonas sp.]
MKARKISITVEVNTDVDVDVDFEYILENAEDDDLKEALEERGFIVLDSTEYAEDRISFDEMTLAIKALEADLRAPGPRNLDVWNLVEKLYRLRTL